MHRAHAHPATAARADASTVALGLGDVVVYRAYAGSAGWSSLTRLAHLRAYERHRMSAFVRAGAAASFAAGRGLLRLVASELTAAPTHKIEFDTSCARCGLRHGPPQIASPPNTGLKLSLSRTRGVIAVAASRFPVGVDIEKIDEFDDDVPLSALHPDEQEEMSTTLPDSQREIFVSLWTRKEAILKASGYGLAICPSRLSVTLGPRRLPLVRKLPRDLGTPTDWALQDISEHDYAGTVAVRGDIRRLLLHTV